MRIVAGLIPLAMLLVLAAGCSMPRFDASLRAGGMEIDGDVTGSAGPAEARTTANRLGLDREAVVQPRVDADWGAWHAWIDGFVVSFSGHGSAEGEISRGGNTIAAGVDTRTDVDIGYLVGGLTFDIFPTDYLDIGVGVAGGLVTYDFEIEERSGAGRVVFDDWLPLAYPVVRLASEIGPVRAFAEGGLMRLEYDDAHYDFGIFEVAAMYRVFGEDEAIQGYATLGYRYLYFDYDYDFSVGGAELDVTLSGPYAGFTMSF
jgi:hypothetical protein